MCYDAENGGGIAMNIKEELEKMPNKKFAYGCILLLSNEGKLNERALRLLTDAEECKRIFMCTKFPVLQEVPRDCTETKLREYCFDGVGRQRYYVEKITVAGKTYVVTNHWYGPNKSNPDNRTPFLQWVMKELE